jgi:hypothetical protein
MVAADAIVKVTRTSTWKIGSYKADVNSGPRANWCTSLIWSFLAASRWFWPHKWASRSKRRLWARESGFG